MFKVLVPGCKPTRGSKFSACVDLYASEDMVIGAGETKIIGLGVAIDLNRGFFDDYALSIGKKDDGMDFEEYYEELREYFYSSHYLQLNPRSSLRAKGLISHTGIIDMDYPKEIKIIIHNAIADIKDEDILEPTLYGASISDDFTATAFSIKKGDRIAQITLVEHKSHLFGIESEEKREDGFGSTGE